MGGIFGIIDINGVTEQDLYPMSQALTHRGPDDEGYHFAGCLGFGCRRLAVVDLHSGRQPLSNEDNSIWTICDGEIYNYKQLRQSLERAGHRFKTKTDLEIIAHLYEEEGENFIGKLRGMFALALWDERCGRLILARDHLGQKPLFYTYIGRKLIFASEIKAILAEGTISPKVDSEALHHYLSLRFIPAPMTMISGIQKLPPAHMLSLRENSCQIRRYWNFSFRDKLELTENEIVEAVRDKFREVITSHLLGDVPVGAFLSGGLDSGLIVAMMSKNLGSSLQTFSVGVENPEFNELPSARELSKSFNTRQFEVCGQPDLIEMLPDMIHHIDEPSDPVAASKYLASGLASQHVKVVLGGDGGDELFAGFDRYFGVRLTKYYSLIPLLLRQRPIEALIQLIPASFGYDSISLKLRWLQAVEAGKNEDDRFAAAVSFFRFNHDEKRSLLGEQIWREVRHADSAEILKEQYCRCDSESPIEKMLYTDYMMRLPEHSLMLTDRMGMAHGLEVRSPYADRELVEFLAKVPVHFKIKGRQRKYIERKIAETELPPGFASKRKRGFRFPLAAWFGNELHPFLQRFFRGSHFVKTGIFREKTIFRLLYEHKARKVDHHIRLWMLLNLEIWNALLVQQRTPDEVRKQIQNLKRNTNL